ncbi:MAG: hypothetical protein UR53_C0001G0160 [Candidatus Magasanikbacteria bacterium GW2011_GWC2_34_16]|uniref:ECF transporter S component n=2 Tax=Candidatus Magasanikiibacteriota TaxID=1752731 RepID=A0A0G0HB17_9BACT|nr:MAG: hypothetical protein UR53_C0001G0160 [Candidatus Magasanikbacteria bacterium GW2011_GWC2_34_16]KKQ40473.1 MAG: hypothetical protein US58_C0020G0014 [Candidatus Magasanikbacteria bacterium GW2011_GWA2_37_8]
MSKKIITCVVFAIIGLIALQIPFTNIIGSSTKFSMFDFYGPIVGGLVGSTLGLLAVLSTQIINWAIHGFALDTATLIRFLPMLLAVLYFSKKSRLILAVPIIAMIAFWAHPEGRGAWYYALYWLIPVAAYFGHKYTILRALGTTFTAHATGSVLFLYAFNLKTAVWVSLIPVVWKERGLMALGITITFIAFSWLFNYLNKKVTWLHWLHLPKYSTQHK